MARCFELVVNFGSNLEAAQVAPLTEPLAERVDGRPACDPSTSTVDQDG